MSQLAASTSTGLYNGKIDGEHTLLTVLVGGILEAGKGTVRHTGNTSTPPEVRHPTAGIAESFLGVSLMPTVESDPPGPNTTGPNEATILIRGRIWTKVLVPVTDLTAAVFMRTGGFQAPDDTLGTFSPVAALGFTDLSVDHRIRWAEGRTLDDGQYFALLELNVH